jgi:hypothetical protein
VSRKKVRSLPAGLIFQTGSSGCDIFGFLRANVFPKPLQGHSSYAFKKQPSFQQTAEPGLRTLDISVLGKLEKDFPGLLTDDIGLLARIHNIQEGAFETTRAIQGAATNRSATKTSILPAGFQIGGAAGYFLGGQSGVGAATGAVIFAEPYFGRPNPTIEIRTPALFFL